MVTRLLDVNVLVALAWPNHVHHARAHAWWRGVSDWATTPVTEAAFIRLALNPHVVGRPVSLVEATSVLTKIRTTQGHTFLPDSASPTAWPFDVSRIATSGQITDAHLIAIAADAGAVLATLDRGIPSMLSEEDRRHVLVIP